MTISTHASRFATMGYGFIGAAAFWTMAHGGPALAQVSGSVATFLKLQATTPGTQQTGNANISGTSIAGQFVGGGAGLTAVNADKLDGLDSTAFLQGVPNPLSLSGSQAGGPVILGANSSSTADSSGVYGRSTSSTGASVGVRGDTTSTTGLGVYGRALSPAGDNFGVWGQAASPTGIGVFGVTTSTTGASHGVMGRSQSPAGYGVYGFNATTSTTAVGVFGEASQINGIGLQGFGNTGVFSVGRLTGLQAQSPLGNGILGESFSNNVGSYGVAGFNPHGTSYGVYSIGDLRVEGDLTVLGSKGGVCHGHRAERGQRTPGQR